MKALPLEGFFEVPPLAEQQAIRQPMPPTFVRCCPWCGSEVCQTRDGLSFCPECERLCEAESREVPVQVYEQGADAVLAWIGAQR